MTSLRLPSMTKHQEIAKLVLAILDKVARMISSMVSSLVWSLAGCELL